jgi:hypothetical protein
MGFFMTVSLPRDPRYAVMARVIAVQSAQDCGCESGAAQAFAGSVEDAARKSLASHNATPHVVMAVERTTDALVVTIDSQVMQLALT